MYLSGGACFLSWCISVVGCVSCAGVSQWFGRLCLDSITATNQKYYLFLFLIQTNHVSRLWLTSIGRWSVLQKTINLIITHQKVFLDQTYSKLTKSYFFISELQYKYGVVNPSALLSPHKSPRQSFPCYFG